MRLHSSRATTLHAIVGLVAAAIAPACLQAQASSDGRSARLDRRIYFPDSSAEARERTLVHAQAMTLSRSLSDSESLPLQGLLVSSDRTLVALQRHAAYWKVVALENVDDQYAKDVSASLAADQTRLGGAMAARLRRVPTRGIDSLGRFAAYARQLQSETTHRLAPDVEEYRTTVVGRATQAMSDAYDRSLETVARAPGTTSLDAATRRSALDQRDAAYDAVAPVSASLLASVIDVGNRDAVAHGFRNAAARKYASLYLTDTAVSRTLEYVAAEAEANRAYQRLLADHAAKRLGVSSARAAEVNVGAPAQRAMAFDEARTLALDALAPLGKDYVHRFGALLDPAAGRLDLSGGAHRAGGGTSIIVYDAPVAFYARSYTGTLASLEVLIHEGGHAIHNEYMNAQDLPVYLRHGPHSLYEGYAIFNELLLYDQAARSARTPEERIQALELFVGTISYELFTSAEETAFEKALYEKASGGPLLTREQIDSLYRAATAPYTAWPMSDAGTSQAWMVKRLLVEDPLYLVNYLYASLVAVALYDRAHTDPDFPSKYARLLGRGFDADPATLLAGVGIMLEDRGLITRAVALFRAKTSELQAAYADEGAAR